MRLTSIQNITILLITILTMCYLVRAVGSRNSYILKLDQLNTPSKGINLGNALDAPSEGEWGVYLKDEYFQLIKEAGFNLVRIPIRWSAHTSNEEPYIIDKVFFERVDWAINQSLSRDLSTMINVHHYEEMMQDPINHKLRFLAIWEQIADRYQNYSSDLCFEILNEPSYNLNSSLWNDLLTEAIEIIRKTNLNRKIIIGPTNWNNIYDLDILTIPEDDYNIIATFHYYSPFQFTHQGAHWVEGSDSWLGTEWQGTSSEKAAIRNDLDVASQWSKKHNKSLFLGEFGAFRKADMESRARWTAFVAREAELRNISWCYWEFCSEFGVYDQNSEKWVSKLLQALLPESPLLSHLTFTEEEVSTTTKFPTTTFVTTNTGYILNIFLVALLILFARKKNNRI